MKQCSLFCAGIWPFLLLPLLLLITLLYFMWHTIEDRVAANATNALAEQHSWASVETFNRGRDVLLSGTPPNKDAIQEAKQLALSGDGVRVVDFHVNTNVAATLPVTEPSIEETVAAVTVITPLSPAALNIRFINDEVIFSGKVDKQSTIDSIIAAANAKYGADNVLNQLVVGTNIDSINHISDLINATDNLGNGNVISLSNNTLSLHGDVASDQIRTNIASNFGAVIEGDIDNQLGIIQSVEVDDCLALLNGLLEEKINFQIGKANIHPDSLALLDKIAVTAERCPAANFEIAGHTDSTGNLQLNMNLSGERAQAVVNRLTSLGLNSDRFTARGYGPTQPISDNNTEAGRAANRRIEFKIKKTGD